VWQTLPAGQLSWQLAGRAWQVADVTAGPGRSPSLCDDACDVDPRDPSSRTSGLRLRVLSLGNSSIGLLSALYSPYGYRMIWADRPIFP
jgi:hypothetical protein